MARNIHNRYVDAKTEHLLAQLIGQDTAPDLYRDTMYKLGQKLGEILVSQFHINKRKICIACTVEDADYLGKGILDVIEKVTNDFFVTVYWNKRFKPSEENGISVAPILREFHDPGYASAEVVIVLKSIIANSCVVRTNLTRLFEHVHPQEIFIVAPVLLKGAQDKLALEFNSEISKKFEYVFFAEDTTKTSDGMVEPGIGGDVYQRLGLVNQNQKNHITPRLVIERREKYLH